jgi:uncharacterized protein (TIGR02284 family)
MNDVITVLNDLIATCRDSEEGFGKAAKGVHDDNLRERLAAISGERAKLADELAIHVRIRGGEPVNSGHLSGIQHSGWRELEERIRPKRDATILAECEQGEQNTVRHYERAMSEEVPAEIREVIASHMLRIQATLQELHASVMAR